jgi:hypothetical protein
VDVLQVKRPESFAKCDVGVLLGQHANCQRFVILIAHSNVAHSAVLHHFGLLSLDTDFTVSEFLGNNWIGINCHVLTGINDLLLLSID